MKRVLCVLLVALLMLGMSALAEPASQEDEVAALQQQILELQQKLALLQGEAPAAEPEEDLENPDLFDFVIKIDGVNYKLPLTIADFEANGWTYQDAADKDEKLSSNHYAHVNLKRQDPFDKTSFQLTVLNRGINSRPIPDCPVVGFSTSYEKENLDVELAGGVKLLASTYEDILAAYGQPTRFYDHEGNYSLDYEVDGVVSNVGYHLSTRGDEKKLDAIRIEYYLDKALDNVLPAGFESQPSELAASYQAPAALGADLLSGNYEIFGEIYQMPTPVQAFLDNGWKRLKTMGEGYIGGKTYGDIVLYKDNYAVELRVDNLSEDAALPEHCAVTRLNTSYHTYGGTLKLPGELRLGMTYDDAMALTQGAVDNAFDSNDYYSLTCRKPDSKHKVTVRIGKEDKLVNYLEIE